MIKLISYATACLLTFPTIGHAEECFYNTSNVNSGQRTAYPANWDGSSTPITYNECSTQTNSYVNYTTPTHTAPVTTQAYNTVQIPTQQSITQTPAPQIQPRRQISTGEVIAANVAADVITYSILRAIFN